MVATLFAISGCAQAPRQVEAQVQLVEPNMVNLGEKLPAKYWPALTNPNTTKIDANGLSIEVGKPYTSGLGQECRSLQMVNHNSENRTRIACAKIVTTDSNSTKTEKAWFLTDDIVESSTIIKIQ